MSFEAITTISEAEESAKRSKAQAVADARAAEANAVAEGKAAIAAAVGKASEELREELSRSDAQALAAAKQMADDTENKIAALRARAEGRLDKAASLVVERIVNG